MWLAWLTAALAARPNVVFISMDTTRADALSCYQSTTGPTRRGTPLTPHLDELAAHGVRLERFYAHAPSTLSSHATMFTGLDPHGHGVVRNGYPLPPRLPVLAERLRSEGYDTIAVVAAGALEAAMGLGRGFRVYDDRLPALRGMMYQDNAVGVVRRTIRALDERVDDASPLFLFVHFYDPHTPYAPPRSFVNAHTDPAYEGQASGEGARFRSVAKATRSGSASAADLEHLSALYLGEVSYMDAQIGALLEQLEERALLDHALVIAVADHGETLADDPVYAWSHGSNVGEEVMRVPLIFRGFGLALPRGVTVRRQAAMSGLAPTIERLLELPANLGDARDFFALVRPGPVFDEDGWPARPTQPAFVEATRPRNAEVAGQWNNARMHRGVFAGGFGAFAAPFLDKAMRGYTSSPHADPAMLQLLSGLLASWDAETPPHRKGEMAPSTRRALEALGYLEPE